MGGVRRDGKEQVWKRVGKRIKEVTLEPRKGIRANNWWVQKRGKGRRGKWKCLKVEKG